MESAGTIPRGAVDLSDWKHLVDGPFLSVYVPTESGVQNAAQKSETEWKSLRNRLEDEGAPEEALAHVDPLVADAHLATEMLAVVADKNGVRLVEHLDDALPQGRGSWAPVADLVPIIATRQQRVAYVTAWADHGGADIFGFKPEMGRAMTETIGDGEPLRKSAPGGWSAPRYQRRAENEWSDNAADAATHVREMAERVDARLIVVGGDVRATHMLADHLPRDCPVHVIGYGRATDGSDAERDEEVRRLVQTAVAEDTVAILEKFKEERGQLDRAVDGIIDTADALARAAVEVLLIHDDRDLLADNAGVVDTLVRDAIATGASARVIPAAGPVLGGVGAILRWA
jgi:release factor family 2